jgi:hypothetical protein
MIGFQLDLGTVSRCGGRVVSATGENAKGL